MILKLNDKQMRDWLKSSLHGNIQYFTFDVRYEIDINGKIVDIFDKYKIKKFRESFLNILGSLTEEIEHFSASEIEKEAEYIYELFSLCLYISQFKSNASLYRLACSKRLKNVFAYDCELHQLLLMIIAYNKEECHLEFLVEQMKNDSNKAYANIAFYALLRYSEPAILFDHMGIFIDRFMSYHSIVTEGGINAIINKFGIDETFNRFKSLEKKLSKVQKKVINKAVYKAGYDEIF